MRDIIIKGIKSNPLTGYIAGMSYAMFQASHVSWYELLRDTAEMSISMTREYNDGKTGTILVYQKNQYVYLYIMDAGGNWQSIGFTHTVIDRFVYIKVLNREGLLYQVKVEVD